MKVMLLLLCFLVALFIPSARADWELEPLLFFDCQGILQIRPGTLYDIDLSSFRNALPLVKKQMVELATVRCRALLLAFLWFVCKITHSCNPVSFHCSSVNVEANIAKK